MENQDCNFLIKEYQLRMIKNQMLLLGFSSK